MKTLCLILSFCIFLNAATAARDMRDHVSQQTIEYQQLHSAEISNLPKRQLTVAKLGFSSKPAGYPVPGGIGFGYWFTDAALFWTDSVVLDYFIVTPDRVGGNMDYFLYLTSSNRSNLGTEAFISYYGQNEATFKVYDWARTDHWQTSINLPTSNPHYLTERRNERGQLQKMCRVSNATLYLGFDGIQHQWRNEVQLFNFDLNDWDLIYQYDYSTATKEENTFQSGEFFGSWGPIVEIWTDEGSYDGLNVVGFDLCRLYLDSSVSPLWLNSMNTTNTQMSFFSAIDPYPTARSFTVYTGNADRDVDGHSFEAEAIANTDPADPTAYLRTSIQMKPNGTVELAVPSPASGRVYCLKSNEDLQMSWDTLDSSTYYGNGDLLFWATVNGDRRFFRTEAKVQMGSLSISCNIREGAVTLNPEAGYMTTASDPRTSNESYTSTFVCLPVGQYYLNFNAVPGHVTPSGVNIAITEGDMLEINAVYAEQ